MDKICSFKNLKPFSRSFNNVKQALNEIGDDWYNYPQYVCSGYVGRHENGKWIVDTASDFIRRITMFFFNFEQEKLEDYYLAYFDILGYKSYFENENDPYEFLTVIQCAIEDMKKGVNITYSFT